MSMTYNFYALEGNPDYKMYVWENDGWLLWSDEDIEVLEDSPYIVRINGHKYALVDIGYLKDVEGLRFKDFPMDFWKKQPYMLISADYLLKVGYEVVKSQEDEDALIQKVTICKGTKKVYVNDFEAGKELISYDEYKNLCKFSKYLYCEMVHRYYSEVMGDLHMELAASEEPYAKSLGELFGSTECDIAGSILNYSTLKVVFRIIKVMSNL